MIKAKYTVVLKSLLDDPVVKPLIIKALSTYPLYVKRSPEEYIPSMVPTREELNDAILRYYKYREIGFETVGRFLDELETTMLEIMPYYNQLFMTADLDYNPIYNVDYKKTITTDREGSSNGKSSTEDNSTVDRTNNIKTDGSSTSSDTGKNVISSTPQGNISVPAENIEGVSHADSVEWKKDGNTATTEGNTDETGKDISTGKSDTTTEGTSRDKEETLETTKGNFGVVSSQDLVQKYRDIILNIKQELINDVRIAELFMQVY